MTARETIRQRLKRHAKEKLAKTLKRRAVIKAALNSGRLITAKEIAAKANCSKREIYREVERLRALGYIIEGHSGIGFTGHLKKDEEHV